MDFWKKCFNLGAVDISVLRQIVKTDSNPYGELSKDEFFAICGETF